MAKLLVNGRKKTLKKDTSIFELLKKYNISTNKVAIELNGKILTKNYFKKRILKDNDRVEIVQFIGGR